LKQNGRASENTVKSLLRASKKGGTGGGKLREMIVRQHAHGRDSLRDEERFHIELRVPLSISDVSVNNTAAPTPAAGGGGGDELSYQNCAFYLLYWPKNWTLGKALDDFMNHAPFHCSSTSLQNSTPPQICFKLVVLRTNKVLLQLLGPNGSSAVVNGEDDALVRSQYLRDAQESGLLQPFDVISFVSTDESLATPLSLSSSTSATTSPQQVELNVAVEAAAVAAADSVESIPSLGFDPVPPAEPIHVGMSDNDDNKTQQSTTLSNDDGDATGLMWSVHVKHGKAEYVVSNLIADVDTVSSLKAKVSERSGVDVKRIKLVYKGVLEEVNILSNTKLKDGCTITMMVK
jgi:hypothetical protein